MAERDFIIRVKAIISDALTKLDDVTGGLLGVGKQAQTTADQMQTVTQAAAEQGKAIDQVTQSTAAQEKEVAKVTQAAAEQEKQNKATADQQERLVETSAKVGKQAQTTAAQTKQGTKTTQEQEKEIAKVIQGLQQQVRELGLTQPQLVAYRLRLLGANDATRQLALSLAKKAEAFTLAEQQAAAYNSRMQMLTSTLLRFIGPAALALAVRQTNEWANEMISLSEVLGIGTEETSKLAFAAEQTRVPLSMLERGLVMIARRTAEAAHGTGRARDAFSALGLSAKELNQLSPEKQLSVIADALGRVNSQNERLRLLTALAGDENVKLWRIMEGGSDAIRRLGEEAIATGKVLDQDMVETIRTADREFNKLKASGSGLALVLINTLGPVVTKIATGWRLLAEGTTRLSEKFGEWIASIVAGPGGKSLVELQQRLFDIKKTLAGERVPSGMAASLEREKTIIEELIRAYEELAAAMPPNDGAGDAGGEVPDDVLASHEQLKQALEKEIQLSGQSGQMAGIRYDLEKGKLAALDPARKQEILDLVNLIEKIQEANAARETSVDLYKKAQADRAKEAEALVAAGAAQEEGLLRQLALLEDNSTAAALLFEIERGRLQGLAPDQAARIVALAEDLDLRQQAIDKEKEAQAARAELIGDLEAVRTSLLSERELIAQHHAERLETLRAALEEELLTREEFNDEVRRSVEKLNDDIVESEKKTGDKMTEFAIQAARNIESAFADFFFNVMQGDFDDLAGNFAKTLQRMAADLAASEVLKFLLGDFGETGKLGGKIGEWFPKIMGMFGFGGKAAGGRTGPGRAFIVGERGPELLFTGGETGQVVPADLVAKLGQGGGGARSITVNIQTPDVESFRKSQGQVATEIGIMIDRALKRNR